MGKERVNTSLRLEKQLLKELKLHALETDTSVQKILEKLIKDYLKKQPKKLEKTEKAEKAEKTKSSSDNSA